MAGRSKRTQPVTGGSRRSSIDLSSLASIYGAPEATEAPSESINGQEIDAPADTTIPTSKVTPSITTQYPTYKQPSLWTNLLTKGQAGERVSTLNAQSALAKANADAELQRQSILEDLRNKNAINEHTY